MGCGCKKKKAINPATQGRSARVVVVDGEIKEVPPQVLEAPEPQPEPSVNEVVNKLNSILKP
jgi:hypothetical protein